MARNITKPQTPPALLAILVKLVQNASPATASDLDTNSIYMGRLVAYDLVKVKDTVKSGQRGRPAHVYAPTSKGRGRAQRAIAKANASQAAQNTPEPVAV